MKTEIIQKNRGETTQRTLWFFGTAPSPKTPRTRIASNFKLYTLDFKLPQVSSRLVVFTLFSLLYTFNFPISANALVTPGIASKAGNLSNGLIAHWTFDGKNLTSSTSTSSTGAYDATSTGPVPAMGIIGQAISLDGTQYLTSNNMPETRGVSKLTISGWVKRNTNSFGSIFNEYDGANPWIYFGFSNNGNLYAFVGNAANDYCITPFPAYTTGWNHYTMVYDGTQTGNTNRIKVYINGALQAETCFGTIAATTGSPTAQNLIGYDIRNGLKLNAYMDDIRVYNRALSFFEVQSLYKMANNVSRAAPTGPVAHWKFDNNTLTSATATDSSGFGNNGTLNGISFPTNITSGKMGQAISFDGATSYINGPDIDSIDGSSALTTCAWIKEPTLAADNAIVVKWNYQTQGTFGFQTGYLAAGKLSMFIATSLADNGSGSLTSTTNTVLVAGQWQHVCAVFDGTLTGNTNRLKIFVNGASVALTQDSGAVPSTLTAGGTGHVIIGKFGENLTRYFNGSIDDVRIYTRALSSSEITSIYKSTQTASTYAVTAPATNPLSNGLVGYWTFDGKNMNSSTSTDSSGNGNNGGFVNTNGSAVVAGKVGQAMNFTAYNQYINVPANSTLDLTNKLSISMWVKPVAAAGTYRHLLTRNNSNVAIYNIALDNNTQRVILQLYGTGNCTLFSTGALQTGVWSHITGTYDGSLATANMKIYINGVQDASTCNYVGNVGASISSVPLTINNDLVNANGVIGSMDDVRLYNRTLSAKEAMALYKMGAK